LTPGSEYAFWVLFESISEWSRVRDSVDKAAGLGTGN
jgi:hypothetical protein